MKATEKQNKLIEKFIEEMAAAGLTISEAETMHVLLRVEIEKKERKSKKKQEKIECRGKEKWNKAK